MLLLILEVVVAVGARIQQVFLALEGVGWY
jgi:hypothetical protein